MRYLVIVAHESAACVFGTQEAVDQHGPAQGEVEADVFLEVAAEFVTVEVVAEGEALSGHHLIHLLSNPDGQQGLQALWNDQKHLFNLLLWLVWAVWKLSVWERYWPIISVCVVCSSAVITLEHLSDIFLPRPSSMCLWSSWNQPFNIIITWHKIYLFFHVLPLPKITH